MCITSEPVVAAGKTTRPNSLVPVAGTNNEHVSIAQANQVPNLALSIKNTPGGDGVLVKTYRTGYCLREGNGGKAGIAGLAAHGAAGHNLGGFAGSGRPPSDYFGPYKSGEDITDPSGPDLGATEFGLIQPHYYQD